MLIVHQILPFHRKHWELSTKKQVYSRKVSSETKCLHSIIIAGIIFFIIYEILPEGGHTLC